MADPISDVKIQSPVVSNVKTVATPDFNFNKLVMTKPSDHIEKSLLADAQFARVKELKDSYVG